MTQSLVSVCIPCHNAASFLGETLECLRRQTHRPIEIIAVADACTDQTLDILRAFERDIPLEVRDVNIRSAAKARNLAASISRGQYIKFLDADDLLSPNHLECQIARLQGHDDCIADSLWGRFYRSPDEVSFPSDPFLGETPSFDWMLNSLQHGGRHSMMQCGMFLIPRSLLFHAGGWDERLTLIDDTEFFTRLILNANHVLGTDAKLYYRSGVSGSLSRSRGRAACESAVLSLELAARHLLNRDDSAQVRRIAADLLMNGYYDIAPRHADLGRRLMIQIADLGGSDLPPLGGPVFTTVSRLLGWKGASRLRNLAGALGYGILRRKQPMQGIPAA